MKERARAWPGPPGPASPRADISPPSKFDASRTGYGLRPSSRRVGLSTPSMTASIETTFSKRRGSGSEPIVEQRGWITSPSLRWRPMEQSAWSPSSRRASVQATTTRHRSAGWRFQSPTASSARWASRLSRTVCASRRPSSSSSPSSRPTSSPARLGSGPSARPPMPWSGSGSASSKATPLCSRPTSRTSSARSTMSDFSLWSASGCRTDGCSSSFDSGCAPGCWTLVSSPSRSRGRPRVGSWLLGHNGQLRVRGRIALCPMREAQTGVRAS